MTIEKARKMAYFRAFLAFLSCRLSLAELRCIAGRALHATRCLSKDQYAPPARPLRGNRRRCAVVPPSSPENRQQKTALPKQSRKRCI